MAGGSDGDVGAVRVVLRPIGTGLPLGFLSFAAVSGGGDAQTSGLATESGVRQQR